MCRPGGLAPLLPRVRGSVLVLAGTKGLAPLFPPIQGFAPALAGVKGLALLPPLRHRDCVLMPRRRRAEGLAPLLTRVCLPGGFAPLLPRVRGSVLVLAGTKGLAPLSPPIQDFAPYPGGS